MHKIMGWNVNARRWDVLFTWTRAPEQGILRAQKEAVAFGKADVYKEFRAVSAEAVELPPTTPYNGIPSLVPGATVDEDTDHVIDNAEEFTAVRYMGAGKRQTKIFTTLHHAAVWLRAHPTARNDRPWTLYARFRQRVVHVPDARIKEAQS